VIVTEVDAVAIGAEAETGAATIAATVVATGTTVESAANAATAASVRAETVRKNPKRRSGRAATEAFLRKRPKAKMS
jgi:hypothetical protein